MDEVRTSNKLSWRGAAPAFWSLHGVALLVFVVPFEWGAVWALLGVYALGMFGITAGYHRYFAHRGYKTSRGFQFVLALLGTFTSQKGVLWWSGHHRVHHRFSDQPRDVHSPTRGFWWAHCLWFLTGKFDATPPSQLKEFSKYPEILFLDRYWVLPPVLLGAGMLAFGGWTYFIWGFALALVVLWHATFTINSLAHLWGARRYDTTDTSRNNPVLALLTFGEGWHNNHHFYPSTANNGFFWWEVDLSYYVLRMLSWFGVVWDLRKPPEWVLKRQRVPGPALPSSMQSAVQVFSEWREKMGTLAETQEAAFKNAQQELVESARKVAEQGAEVAASAATAARRYAEDMRSLAAEKRALLAETAAREAVQASQAARACAEAMASSWAQAWAEATEQAAAKARESAQLARAAVVGVPVPASA